VKADAGVGVLSQAWDVYEEEVVSKVAVDAFETGILPKDGADIRKDHADAGPQDDDDDPGDIGGDHEIDSESKTEADVRVIRSRPFFEEMEEDEALPETEQTAVDPDVVLAHDVEEDAET
jgi:hypothetical protein